MYNFAPQYFFDAFGPILACLKTTMLVTLVSFLIAFVLAILLALLAMVKNRPLQAVLKVWLSLFRGTPLIAQLYLFVYGVFPLIPGVSAMSLEFKCILCLALSFSAFMAETIRGAILSVDKGQMEACITGGMTSLQGYTHVVLPQAFQMAIPSLMNNFIECFKGSAMVSVVGVIDMMLQAKMLANKSYRFMEVFLCVLLLYWVINMVFVAIQRLIEQKANAKYS